MVSPRTANKEVDGWLLSACRSPVSRPSKTGAIISRAARGAYLGMALPSFSPSPRKGTLLLSVVEEADERRYAPLPPIEEAVATHLCAPSCHTTDAVVGNFLEKFAEAQKQSKIVTHFLPNLADGPL